MGLRSSEAFCRFVLDQLEPLDVLPRGMFGAIGLYCRGAFFGIIANDTLYMKVDDSNRAMYEREEASRFKPFPNRPASMNYYAVPLAVLESAPQLLRWARLSVRIASAPEGTNGGRRRRIAAAPAPAVWAPRPRQNRRLRKTPES